jgi:hypothetical protein
VRSILNLLVLLRLWAQGAAVDPAEWPDLAVWVVLPIWVLLVMALLQTASVFSSEKPAENVPSPSVWPSTVSLISLEFLVVLGAVAVVSAPDWLIRVEATLMGMSEAI